MWRDPVIGQAIPCRQGQNLNLRLQKPHSGCHLRHAAIITRHKNNAALFLQCRRHCQIMRPINSTINMWRTQNFVINFH